MDVLKILRILAFIFLVLAIIAFLAPIPDVWFRISIAILLVISLIYQVMKRKSSE